MGKNHLSTRLSTLSTKKWAWLRERKKRQSETFVLWDIEENKKNTKKSVESVLIELSINLTKKLVRRVNCLMDSESGISSNRPNQPVLLLPSGGIVGIIISIKLVEGV